MQAFNLAQDTLQQSHPLGTTRTLTYGYNRDGNRTWLGHPDGTAFSSYYDGLDRLIMTMSGASAYIYTVFRPDGSRQAIGTPSASAGFDYDGVGRPSAMMDDFAGSSADASWSYTRDAASGLRAVARDNDSYAWGGHYTVNRGYTANGLNQYSAAGGASFAYDANGNLTSDGATTYGYDIENRLVSATGGHNATLAYDPLGRLAQVTSGSNTTRFLYDGDALVAEYNGSGTMTQRHLHAAGADVPMVSFAGTNLSTPRFLYADHQGSIIAGADTSGAAVVLNRYDEYGIPASTNTGRFAFTGQSWLSEIGLYYYKARVYSPTLGRFLQSDPVGYEDQFNLYAYVGDDPVNHTDPTGRDAVVLVRPNGDLDIRLPVYFHGDAATPENIAEITRSMQSLSQEVGGTRVTVTVVPVSSQDIANGNAPIYNRVELSAGPLAGGNNAGHSYINPQAGNDAHINMMDQHSRAIVGVDRGSVGGKGEETGAHYAGHLMGLVDDHRIGNDNTNVMQAGSGTALTAADLRRVTQPDPPGTGVRNRVVHCPHPDCEPQD